MDQRRRTLTLIAVVVLVVVAAIIIFFAVRPVSAPAPTDQNQATATGDQTTPAETDQSLGAEIFKKSQNPLEDKVPALSPASNPIEGAYTNPFE